MHISNAEIQKVLRVHMHRVYGAQSKARTSAASGADSLTLSSKAQDMQQVREALATTPDIRNDVVANLKSSVDSGDYSVSSDGLAEAIFQAASQSRTIG